MKNINKIISLLYTIMSKNVLINVLTYNISWATQSNQTLGSEADFVEQCQKTYKKGGVQCTNNAIKNIGTLKPLDLIGLQEVNALDTSLFKNNELENKIMEVQPNLKKFKRGQIGLSTVSTLWNPDIFGDLIYDKIINIKKGDDRPCLILIFKKDDQIFVIINLHTPWLDENIDKTNLIKELENNINKNKKIKENIFNKNTKIIVTGDFNDGKKTFINKNNPLVLKNNKNTIKLKYNKTKEQARKTLKSCCWHKPNHKNKYFKETGDYILVNKNIKQKSINIPEIFKKKGRLNRLFSDHLPVLSTLEL